MDAILANFTKMMEHYPNLPVHVRTPVVPGFNDTVQDILPIAELAAKYPNADLELLPYHRLGMQKYLFLGREYPMGEVTLDETVMDGLLEAVKNATAVKICNA
jgi:pyruvate formate lyase activating enzyme